MACPRCDDPRRPENHGVCGTVECQILYECLGCGTWFFGPKFTPEARLIIPDAPKKPEPQRRLTTNEPV